MHHRFSFAFVAILSIGFLQIACKFGRPAAVPRKDISPQTTTPSPQPTATGLPYPEHLIAAYSFNANAQDTSGNGHDGVVYGARPTADRFGNPESAYYFDGNQSYIQMPLGANNFEGDFTLIVWVNFQNFGANYPMIILGEECFLVFQGMGPIYHEKQGHIGFYQQSSQIYTGTNRIGELISYRKLTPGEWVMLAISRKSNEYSLYLNDEKDSWTRMDTSINLSGEWLLVGGKLKESLPESESLFTGNIDDLYLYDMAFSEESIASLYQNGINKK